MVTVGQASTWNSWIVGGISCVLNTLLLYVIYSRTIKSMGAFKYMMMATTMFDILFSIVYIIASPTFATSEIMSSLLIVKGGIRLPRKEARVMLVIFVLILCQSLVIPPCLFVFRYFQICRSTYLAKYYQHLRYLLLIPIFISIICSTLLCFAAWPSESDLVIFDPIAFHTNVDWNSTYLVASFQKPEVGLGGVQKVALMIVSILLFIVLIVALALMVFCTTSIMAATRNGANEKTRTLQFQLFRTLIAQFAVPFLFIHVPFYLCVLAPLVRLNTGGVSNYLPFLFAWTPAINPLVVLYFVRDYRKFLLKVIGCDRISSTHTSAIFLNSSRINN